MKKIVSKKEKRKKGENEMLWACERKQVTQGGGGRKWEGYQRRNRNMCSRNMIILKA